MGRTLRSGSLLLASLALCLAAGARSALSSPRGGSASSRGDAIEMGALGGGGQVPTFIRGNANGDAKPVDLADVVAIVSSLFLGTGPLACRDAGDADDNGLLEINDAIFLVTYMFNRGPRPPAPFPTAGTDPTNDTLTCGP